MFGRKKIIVTALLTLMSFFSVISTQAQSVSEIQSKIDTIKANKAEKIAQLEQSNRTIDETRSQIEEINQRKSELVKEIEATTSEINTLTAKITETELEIPKQIDKSNNILKVLQKTSRENFLIEELFANDTTPSTAIRKVRASTVLTDESVKVVNSTISLQNNLKVDKENLIAYQDNLQLSELELASQEEYLAILLKDAEVDKSEAEEGIIGEESSLAAEQSLIDLMQAAGCSGDQVYGVDCGVPPPVIAPTQVYAQLESTDETVSEEPVASETIPINQSGMIRPTTSGYVSDEYGIRSEYGGVVVKNHNGIDIANSCGTPVYSVASGKVVWTGYDRAGGNMAIIVHNIGGEQISTSYAHFQSPAYVSPGQVVSSDTQIGAMGTTGYSTGCHLHLGISTGPIGSPSTRFNPRNMINFPPLGQKFNSRY